MHVERIDEGRSRITLRFEAPDAERVTVAGGLGALEPHDTDLRREDDAWVRTYESPSNLRTLYGFIPDGNWMSWDKFVPDPGNPRTYVFPADEEEEDGKELVLSLLELPDAPAFEWSPSRDVPRGRVKMHRLGSERLGNERRVYRYDPPGGKPEAVLVLFDGWAFTQICSAPTVLDNLIAAGEIPPVLAILPDSLDQETRTRELTCGDAFLAFVVDELLPWAGADADPERTVVAGSSLGGLMAGYAGLRRPDVFGNVLSMSGSFQREPPGKRPGWVPRHLAETERLPVRWYLDAGELEVWTFERRAGIVHANRHLADVLRAKGYDVTHREFPGGHDYLWWNETIAWGLQALLGVN
jgi:enterochelin esterase-like enzyme